MKMLDKLAVGILRLADLAVSVWCLGAIWFLRAVPSPTARLALVAILALVTLAVLVGTFRRRWILFVGLVLPIGCVAGWLHLLEPTGALDWDVPLQKMPHTTFAADGHTVTIENVRDFRYRAEFYNGILYNCLSCMAPTAEKLSSRFCSGRRGTFNGITDRIGCFTGWLRRKRPDETFEEMRERCSANKYVKDVDKMSDYSRLLRKGF